MNKKGQGFYKDDIDNFEGFINIGKLSEVAKAWENIHVEAGINNLYY